MAGYGVLRPEPVPFLHESVEAWSSTRGKILVEVGCGPLRTSSMRALSRVLVQAPTRMVATALPGEAGDRARLGHEAVDDDQADAVEPQGR